ncbi:LGFP repeat-containing protein [Blastococcus xanthinilyticus]|uniref:LGFP repeat-containing protein n=1 Tax=Blastococcus xanthinilyticus TaxID=1564164 RepID=A0A5S5CTQ3_9ACTN|nr:LGFP repeat-containing protein [Blastococcus xanthinilyticus]
MLLTAAPAPAEPVDPAPGNRAPVAVDDAVSYSLGHGRDWVVPALANDSDPEGDALTVTAVTPATKGRAFVEGGRLFYSPWLGYEGTDTFTYTVSDGHGNTATGTVTATLWLDPGTPMDVGITSPAPGSVTVTWAATARAETYRVYRNGVLRGTTSELSWTDTGLLDTVWYQYRIAAVNGGGSEGWQPSPIVHRSRQPAAPAGLVADGTDTPTTLALTWATGGRAGPWRVYRDGVLLTTTTEPRFQDTGLVTGREYSYQVQVPERSDATLVQPAGELSAPVRATPVELTAIGRLFWQLGWRTGFLGAVTVPERAIAGGRQQDHDRGLILQQDGQDPLTVSSDYATLYVAAGGAGGALGFPVDDRRCDRRDRGCAQFFEGGSIWSRYGTWGTVVGQVVEDAWSATGLEDGWLGYPTSDLVQRRGGTSQQFEGGAVYWSPATSSHGVWAPVLEAWGRLGYETGVLGYPVSDDIELRGGSGQVFQGGAVYWSERTGAHAIGGAIRATWGRTGYENGVLGYPSSDPITLRGGVGQRFAGGKIYWTPATGAHVVRGWLGDTWAAWGSEVGVLGYPLMSEVCGLRGGGCGQVFQGGSIYLTAATGSHVIGGAIRDRWAAQGYEAGSLGYPTSDHICGLRQGGCGQLFQGGRIYWTPATGAHSVRGVIGDAWAAQGWEAGRLGYPVGGELGSSSFVVQQFQGGQIMWRASTGRTTVTYHR